MERSSCAYAHTFEVYIKIYQSIDLQNDLPRGKRETSQTGSKWREKKKGGEVMYVL